MEKGSFAQQSSLTDDCRRSWRLRWLIAVLFSVSSALTSAAAQQVSGQSAGTLRIYLARHGETEWNVERRLQGGTDTALNATGRQQAAKLRDLLRGLRLDAVYSSTLSRSRETAEVVRGQVPLKSDAGLNERKLGKFEGRRVDASDPETAAEYKRRGNDPDDAFDGGESLNQFYERVRPTISSIREQHTTGTILIVGHQGTNRMILRALLGLTREQAQAVNQANDEVYLIELESGNSRRLWKLVPQTNLNKL
jgi:2,3-bisphosphoglycerate-dependent phosphoglycerate mutase